MPIAKTIRAALTGQMTEVAALKILADADTAIATAAAEAAAELQGVQASLAKHEALVRAFRDTGKGMEAAKDSLAYIEQMDRLFFPTQTAINPATAAAQRQQHFTFQIHRVSADAREAYIRSHAEELQKACEALVAHRSRYRDKWRQQVVEQAQALKSREMLGEALTVDESRRVEHLDRALASQDDNFGQANNAVLKFISAPTNEHFNEVRMHASRIDYEVTP